MLRSHAQAACSDKSPTCENREGVDGAGTGGGGEKKTRDGSGELVVETAQGAKMVVLVTQEFSDVTHTPGIPAISRSRSVLVIAAESFGDCMTLHDVRTALDFSFADGGSIVYLKKTKIVVGIVSQTLVSMPEELLLFMPGTLANRWE
jgi:hypothetical protein